MKILELLFEDLKVEIQLEKTPCAEALFQAAPFESLVHLWGD
jgi:hypothetical protein